MIPPPFMRFLRLSGLLALLHLSASGQVGSGTSPVLVIHGGAGVILPERMTPEREALTRQTLTRALSLGDSLLQAGRPATEVVVRVVSHLEDSGVFNTGKGAVRTTDGRAELDASLMDGQTGQAGAVAGLTTTRNPIQAAEAVMRQTPHVLLIGSAADAFARSKGLAQVTADYFQRQVDPSPMKKHGTVGAVALDRNGNLAAATSTGGTDQKLPGRVGDAPIIGAGTYASNRTCAVSATGHGEYFIRQAVAYDIHARMRYLGQRVQDAAQAAITELTPLGGTGGVIALDAAGNVAMPFNTPGMYRGLIRSGQAPQVWIYRDR